MKHPKIQNNTWNLKAPMYERMRNLSGLSWILDAENRVFGYLLEYVTVSSESRILDIGTGDGNIIGQLPEAHRSNIIAIDTNMTMVKQARKKFPETVFLHGDSRSLPV